MRQDKLDTRVTKLCICIEKMAKALDDAPLDSRDTLNEVLDALGKKVVELLEDEVEADNETAIS